MSDQQGQDQRQEVNHEEILLDAFLEGPLILGDIVLRPYSAGTLLLAHKLQHKLALYGGRLELLTGEEILREVEVYVWMQHEDISIVQQAVRLNVWPGQASGYMERCQLRTDDEVRNHEIIAAVVHHLQQQAKLVQATKLKLSGGKAAAPNIFHPCWLARLVHIITQNKGWAEDWVTWYLPYARALQYEHCQLRTMGWKTLKPGAVVNVDADEELRKAEEAAKKQQDAGGDDEEW